MIRSVNQDLIGCGYLDRGRPMGRRKGAAGMVSDSRSKLALDVIAKVVEGSPIVLIKPQKLAGAGIPTQGKESAENIVIDMLRKGSSTEEIEGALTVKFSKGPRDGKKIREELEELVKILLDKGIVIEVSS